MFVLYNIDAFKESVRVITNVLMEINLNPQKQDIPTDKNKEIISG